MWCISTSLDSRDSSTGSLILFLLVGLRGQETCEANDGVDGLKKLSADTFDLILTDVTLKGELSGVDVVQRVRVDFGYGKRRLPILVMTGDSNRDNQSELLKAGANDLVLKPIEERLLVTKVLFQLRVSDMGEARAEA